MIEHLTLYQAFQQASLKVPDETAIYYFNTKISFEKLSK